MNTQKIKLALFTICGLMFFPTMTQAATAVQLNDTTALFSVDFSFLDEKFVVDIPIAAEYGVTYLDRVDTVGYTVTDKDGNVVEVTEVNALVLSTTPVNETRYTLATGVPGDFNLVILAEFAEPITNDYKATITKLPYFLDERRTTMHQNQLDEIVPAILNPSEPVISLKAL